MSPNINSKHDVTPVTLPWMRQGTAHLLAVVDKLADQDLRAPSAPPGWSRAHVIGHVARNAEALARLAAWARTGIETPMYADREQRATEIEMSTLMPAYILRTQLIDTAAALDTALTRLTAGQWQPFLGKSAHTLVEVIRGATITDLPGLDQFAHLVDPAGFSAVVRSAIR